MKATLRKSISETFFPFTVKINSMPLVQTRGEPTVSVWNKKVVLFIFA